MTRKKNIPVNTSENASPIADVGSDLSLCSLLDKQRIKHADVNAIASRAEFTEPCHQDSREPSAPDRVG